MATQHTITGTLQIIGDVQTFPSGFSKREIVVEVVDGQYSEMIPIDLFKDKANLVETYQPGEVVTVFYNMKGSEHNGRRYVDLNGWKIERQQQQQQQAPVLVNAPPPQQQSQAHYAPNGMAQDNHREDLPF